MAAPIISDVPMNANPLFDENVSLNDLKILRDI